MGGPPQRNVRFSGRRPFWFAEPTAASGSFARTKAMLLFQTAPGARSAWLSARGRGDGAEQEGGRGETRRKRAAGRRSVGAEGLVLVDSKRHQGVCVCVCVCVYVWKREGGRERH